ncbi:MAG: glycosyltransferase [Candidatus Fermentibacteraceae bacterium]|nr:glycosyltransferase [Candidatus Fermentibacteraceae bacterium]MBN2609807.1 glycosyltransferase [Candidatus Fermentibacteraceae bacterium]
MVKGRITYFLGFLPTYVLREIMELGSRGFPVDVFLPESDGTSDFWMDIISDQEIDGTIAIRRDIRDHVARCRPWRLTGFFLGRCLPVLFLHPFRFPRLAAASIRVRSFRFFLLGASLSRRIRRDTLLIHSHFARSKAFTGMWAAKLLGIPFSVTTHAVDIFVPRREELVRYMLHEADSVLTISLFNRDYMARRYGEYLREKVRVTHLGLDQDSLPPRRSETGSRPLVVCTASGLGEKKGVPVLVEACRILVSRGLSFGCRVIGSDMSGELLERFRSQAVSSGLSGILEFTGKARSDEVLECVAGADIFVLPSVRAANGDMDGIPVSLMESMSMGVPTVSTSISGIPELVENGVSGLLVTPGDPEELADALASLISDPLLASKLGEAGMLKARSGFSVSAYVTRLLESWPLSASRD